MSKFSGSKEMMPEEHSAEVAGILRSLVSVYAGRGKGWATGVFIRGRQIVTAAHCLPRIPGALGYGQSSVLVKVGDYPEHRRTTEAFVSFVDPQADIAVIDDHDIDHDDLPDYGEAWEEFLSSGLKPARLLRKLPTEKFRVHVRTIDQQWVHGTAGPCTPRTYFRHVELSGRTPGGTSGAPAVDDRGRVVGIVSQAYGVPGRPANTAVIVVLCRCLPPRITQAGAPLRLQWPAPPGL